MKIPQFVRRVAFVTALAVTSVAVPARIASAQPNDVCQNLANLVALDIALASNYLQTAGLYYRMGDYISGYIYEEASHQYYLSALEYQAEYDTSCRASS